MRLALARSPGADESVLSELVADGVGEIRRAAASNRRAPREAIAALVRAGSTPDLLGLADPDPGLAQRELVDLASGGPWARQLAVRHPNTPPDVVARLLRDENPRIREWASVHPNAPAEVIDEIRRAGGAEDFQGLAVADPDLVEGALRRVAKLGPWGALVVSRHPHAPPELVRPTWGDHPPGSAEPR